MAAVDGEHGAAVSKNMEQEEERAVAAEGELMLIPGMPDDVAMECLARVPSRWHCPMRRACRGWRGAVGSPEFVRRRRIAGVVEDVVFFVHAAPAPAAAGDGRKSSNTTPVCGLATANVTTGEWRRVEGSAASWGAVPLFAQCAAAGDGRHVAVVGGWDPATLRPTRGVRVLDVLAGTWRRGQPMPDSRSFFGCAGCDGSVHIAGGHDESKDATRSAFSYDVAADAWRALPDMSEERDEPQLVATPGRVLAAGGYPTEIQGGFKKTAECYAAGANDAWSDEGDMLPGTARTAGLASVGGEVWAVAAGKGGVRRWGGAGDAWASVADGPPGMKACVRAVGVGDGASVFVFGKEGDGAGDGKHAAWALDMDAGGGGARWRRVPVPPGFGGFVYSAAAVRV